QLDLAAARARLDAAPVDAGGAHVAGAAAGGDLAPHPFHGDVPGAAPRGHGAGDLAHGEVAAAGAQVGPALRPGDVQLARPGVERDRRARRDLDLEADRAAAEPQQPAVAAQV